MVVDVRLGRVAAVPTVANALAVPDGHPWLDAHAALFQVGEPTVIPGAVVDDDVIAGRVGVVAVSNAEVRVSIDRDDDSAIRRCKDGLAIGGIAGRIRPGSADSDEVVGVELIR